MQNPLRNRRAALAVSSALWVVWGVLHIWVGAEGVRQYLAGGTRGLWNMVIGGRHVSRAAFQHTADPATAYAQGQLILNFCLDVGRYGVLALIMLMYLILGCLMDAMAMIILTVPIIYPVILSLGFDPIWFGVIIVMTVELGLIHPPVGMNVFVIKSVIKEVTFTTIFKGVIPFVVTDLIRLLILIAFPVIALWLPSKMV